MVGRYISELVEGARVDATFVLRSREVRATRAGDAYLALELSDRSGTIPAVLFRPSARSCSVPSGAVVRVTGTITTFRGTRRVSLDDLSAADTWDAEDLIGVGRRPGDELIREFKGLVGSVSDQPLRRVLRAVFSDKEFLEIFCRCPGSDGAHHAFAGGLLEHTVSVAASCAAISDLHPEADRDLLVAAALLHDIGMVDALSWGSGIAITDSGRMLGCGALGLLRLHDAAAKVRVDRTRLTRLQHAVLSPHAPGNERPATVETLVLVRMNELDARLARYTDAVGAATRVEESWARSDGSVLYAPSAA